MKKPKKTGEALDLDGARRERQDAIALEAWERLHYATPEDRERLFAQIWRAWMAEREPKRQEIN